jgi:hypothetical protein
VDIIKEDAEEKYRLEHAHNRRNPGIGSGLCRRDSDMARDLEMVT